jgi:serine phosphatase RsbU (regulator of sigma subunit)
VAVTARGATRKSASDSAITVPTGRIRTSGMGVAARFSLATAFTIAASFVVFGAIVYSMLRDRLSQEIDEAGVMAVRALASIDAKCWMPLHGTALEGFEQDVIGKSNVPSLPPDKKEQYERRYAQNLGRTQALVQAKGTKLLDAVVIDERQTLLSGAGMFKFDRDVGSEKVVDEVGISAGVYKANGDTRARTYTAPIFDDQHSQRGTAVVVLSAEKIDESLTKMLTSLAILTAVFIGVGILVSTIQAKGVTKPIQQLCDDVDTVARGRLDHRTHAHSTDEIGALARTFDRMTQSLFQMQDVQRQQAAQAHQIEVAREVQAALLPEKLPEVAGFDCAAASRPTAQVAGDFYAVFEMGGGAKLLAVVSASGKGVPGAMVVTMARSLLVALAPSESSPAELLRRVNRALAPDLRRGMYVSALLVRVTKEKLVVANAGHHPLLLARGASARLEVLHSDGIALGFDKGPVFDRTIKDRELELAAGDRVLLVTRSLFALKNGEGREVGEDAVYSLVTRAAKSGASSSGELVAHLLSALDKFRGDAEPSEDVVLLTLKRTAS